MPGVIRVGGWPFPCHAFNFLSFYLSVTFVHRNHFSIVFLRHPITVSFVFPFFELKSSRRIQICWIFEMKLSVRIQWNHAPAELSSNFKWNSGLAGSLVFRFVDSLSLSFFYSIYFWSESCDSNYENDDFVRIDLFGINFRIELSCRSRCHLPRALCKWEIC